MIISLKKCHFNCILFCFVSLYYLQNPVILKASKGATCNHAVTVINDSTMPVVYDIHIEGDSDVLSVSPSTLDMQPKQCATLSVSYIPQTYNAVKG